MIPLEALKNKEGAAYLAGAAVCFLISAILVATGIDRFLQEDALRGAVAAFHRDAPDARSQLVELKDARPTDATMRVLLGCIEVERGDGDADRLGVAERLFEEALGLDPSRASAHIGQAVARLKLGAMKPKDGRVQAAKLVAEDLDRANLDATDPDVIGLRAAVELMRGRNAEALKLLDAAPTIVPSRDGQTAWRWNRALATCLVRRRDGLEDALAAYALRRFPMLEETVQAQEVPKGAPLPPPPEVARLLIMAYRVALAEPNATPATAEAVLARCELAKGAIAVRAAGGGSSLKGRFLPPTPHDAIVFNALGMAYARLERWTDAANAFEEARRAGPKDEPLYVLNFAEARRREALALPPEQAKQASGLLSAACEAYGRVCEMLAGKEGREATRVLAATNGAALYISMKQPQQAIGFYKGHSEGHPNAAERARNLGALLDHGNHRGCVEEYRRAVSLSHPDSAALERRVRIRSRQ